MKFKNIFKSSLIIFIALFSFSCNNLFDDIGGPDANQALQVSSGRYITFTGDVQTNGAVPQEIASEIQKLNSKTDDSSRSALPTIDNTTPNILRQR